MINVGFIGVGGMGRYQARAFSQVRGCRVYAGADVSEASREQFQKDFDGARVYHTQEELLGDTQVDAVVIATPTLFHKDAAIAAMKSGRPVMTEKPLARTVSDGHRMIEASEKTGQLLMVAHCRRFDTDWGTWAKIFRSGALGTPVVWRHVHASLLPGPAWFADDKLSGGPLMDGAVHNYDFGNMLFGRPVEVLASSVKLTRHTAVDCATAVVRYESGNQLMVSWAWGVRSIQSAHDVLGPKGTMVFGAGETPPEELGDTKQYGYYLVADPTREKKKLYRFERRDMYATQAKHFLDCVRGKAECRTPATEAIKAVAVAEAILKAAPAGKVRRVSW